ncbi:MmyB family transcriptional regulator, partial [Kitasatospora sp. NPDC001574]
MVAADSPAQRVLAQRQQDTSVRHGTLRLPWAQHADRPDDRELTALVTRLSARSPQFAALWARHRAAPP